MKKKVSVIVVVLVLIAACITYFGFIRNDAGNGVLDDPQTTPTAPEYIPDDPDDKATDIIEEQEDKVVDVLEETEEGTIIGTTQSGEIAEIVLPDIPEDTGIPEYGTPEYEQWAQEQKEELSAKLDAIFGLTGDPEPSESLPVEEPTESKPVETPAPSAPVETPAPSTQPEPSKQPTESEPQAPTTDPQPTPSQSQEPNIEAEFGEYVSVSGLTDEEIVQLKYEEAAQLPIADYFRWCYLGSKYYGSIGGNPENWGDMGWH